MTVEIPQALRLNFILKAGHLIGGFIRIIHGQLIVAVENGLFFLDAEHDIFTHIQVFIQLRLLRQIADARALRHKALAGIFRIHAGHDFEQRGFARAVDAEHTDFRIGIKREVNIFQNLLATRIGLVQALHMIDKLTCHRANSLSM